MRMSVREFYGFSRGEWFVFLAVRWFTILMLALNAMMFALNLYLTNYMSSTVSAIVAITLALVITNQQLLIARHRRLFENERHHWIQVAATAWPTSWWNPQQELDQCFEYNICPDCGKQSLADLGDGDLMCSEIGCNSRFKRDPVSREWTRSPATTDR